jgi:hypothetical protein
MLGNEEKENGCMSTTAGVSIRFFGKTTVLFKWLRREAEPRPRAGLMPPHHRLSSVVSTLNAPGYPRSSEILSDCLNDSMEWIWKRSNTSLVLARVYCGMKCKQLNSVHVVYAERMSIQSRVLPLVLSHPRPLSRLLVLYLAVCSAVALLLLLQSLAFYTPAQLVSSSLEGSLNGKKSNMFSGSLADSTVMAPVVICETGEKQPSTVVGTVST